MYLKWLKSHDIFLGTVLWLCGILIFSVFQHCVTFHFVGLCLKLHPVPVSCQLPHFCHILCVCGRSKPAVMSAWCICKKKKKRSTDWQWRGEGDGRIVIRFLLSFICLHAISSWVQYVSGAGKGHEKQTMTEGSYKKKTEKYRSTCRSKSPPFLSFWLFFSILLFLSLL